MLFRSFNLALLKFLLLNVIIRRFDTQSVHYLDVILFHFRSLLLNFDSLLVNFSLKLFILLFQLLESFGYRVRLGDKLFS